MNPATFTESVNSAVGAGEFEKYIHNAIIRGQHCQRNWDLTKKIPQEHKDLIVYSATQCPSKQNMNFYKVTVIEDRDTIEKLYEYSQTQQRKNSQMLANMLLVFSRCETTHNRSKEQRKIGLGIANELDLQNLEEDTQQAIGVAAGFVNMTAAMLGYQTGCNKCVLREGVKELLGLSENEEPVLTMGVGIKDPTKNRKIDHETGKVVVNYPKAEIEVNYI